MEVIVVLVPGADFSQPRAIVPGDFAECLFDGGMHENTSDLCVGGCAPEKLDLCRRPFPCIGRQGGLIHHIVRSKMVALTSRERVIGHQCVPKVYVEAHLVARVTALQRASDRLGHVAYENARQAVQPPHVAPEPLDVRYQDGMAPNAIAREPHRLPSGAAGSDFLRTRDATPLIMSNRLRSLCNGHFHRAERLLRFLLIERRVILSVHSPAKGSQERAGDGAKDKIFHVSAQRGPMPDHWGSVVRAV